jgi:hypothetical protein
MTPDDIEAMLVSREVDRAEAVERFVRDLRFDPVRQAEREQRGMPSVRDLAQLPGYVPPERVDDVVKHRMAVARLSAGCRIMDIAAFRDQDAAAAHARAVLIRNGVYHEPVTPG